MGGKTSCASRTVGKKKIIGLTKEEGVEGVSMFQRWETKGYE